MKILFITAGMVPVAGVSNSYQEAIMHALSERGHDIAALCTAEVSLRLGISSALTQEKPFRMYTIYNAGVYPAAYPAGGVGTKQPLRDVTASAAYRHVFRKILQEEHPEVVSIQSLFGFPLDLLEEIQREKIPVVFTAHDYFALCPTAHLFLPSEQRCRLPAGELICQQCCASSPSYEVFWLSSQLSRWAESLVRFPTLRTALLRLRNSVTRMDQWIPQQKTVGNDAIRRRQAVSFLQRVDVLHCISQHQADIFQELCGSLKNIHILPLMPSTIEGVEKVLLPIEKGKKLIFVALNIQGAMKGEGVLKKSFQRLGETEAHYELHIYGNDAPGLEIPSVSYHGHYDHADLDEIAATADFCIIPSLCDETLGFTGLEMLARGVPLIVSDRAGASEFIESGVNGFLFDPASAEELLQIIRQLHHDTTLVKYVQSPGRNCTKKIESFSEHVTEMEALFSSTIFSEKSKR